VAVIAYGADGGGVDENQFCGTSMRSKHASILRQ
jgi:hypothetical protein